MIARQGPSRLCCAQTGSHLVQRSSLLSVVVAAAGTRPLQRHGSGPNGRLGLGRLQLAACQLFGFDLESATMQVAVAVEVETVETNEGRRPLKLTSNTADIGRDLESSAPRGCIRILRPEAADVSSSIPARWSLISWSRRIRQPYAQITGRRGLPITNPLRKEKTANEIVREGAWSSPPCLAFRVLEWMERVRDRQHAYKTC